MKPELQDVLLFDITLSINVESVLLTTQKKNILVSFFPKEKLSFFPHHEFL